MTTRRELEEDRPTPDEVADLLAEEGTLPEVRVGSNLIATMDAIWDAVVRANDRTFPRVMQRGGELVRFHLTSGLLETYTDPTFLVRMAESATFTGKDGKSIKPPRDVVKPILTRDEHHDAPVVDGIARMPFLGRDMKLHTEPGYHPGERIWLAPDVALPPIPENPHHDAVDESVRFLMNDWLGDFQFADQPSRAHALALALLPFVRPAIREATPLHICHAPEPGSGKSLLAKVALMPGCGEISLVSLDRWSSEQKREVTSWLLEGKPVIWFDNQESGYTVDSGLLSALLTEPSYSGRIMGKTAAPAMPIRCTWVMTGNNLAFTDELVRRSVLIQFDPGTVRPSERGDYKHTPLTTWTMAHRTEIAYALLTLVQHWAAGATTLEHLDGGTWGRESWRVRSDAMKGTFEEWAQLVGSILEAAGVKGFLGNEADMKRLTTTVTEYEGFLDAVRDATGGEPFKASELAALCREKLRDLLPAELSGERIDLEAKLGVWLKANRGTWHGDRRLVKQGDRKGSPWIVEAK